MNKNITSHSKSLKYILIAFCLTLTLMIAEFIAAYYSNSLALFADGTHLLIHNSSLLIAIISSYISFKLSKHKPNNADLVDIIGGIINCVIFLSIAIIISFKGFERLELHHSALDINPIIMGLISFVAFFVHCLSAYILSKGRKHSFNVHAIFLHTFFDCLSTILTFIASIIIFFTDFKTIDSFVSFIIALLIAFSGFRLLKKCVKKALFIHKGNVLVKKIDSLLLKEISHIKDIHEQEVVFKSNKACYSAHIVLSNTCISKTHDEECLTKIEKILADNFDINDTIIQLEYN